MPLLALGQVLAELVQVLVRLGNNAMAAHHSSSVQSVNIARSAIDGELAWPAAPTGHQLALHWLQSN